MAQAALQGATLADPSNPEGNKILLRATALGLGALSRNPTAAAVMYGAAEGGARHIDTGSIRKGLAAGFENGITAYTAGGVLKPLTAPLANVNAASFLQKVPLSWPAAKQATREIAKDAAYLVQSNLARPTQALSKILFERTGKEVLPSVGTAARTAIDIAADAGIVAMYGEQIRDTTERSERRNLVKALQSADGAASGAGDAYVNSHTNSVPAAVSQDARVNRDLIRKAYREYDATTNKEAFAESLRSIVEDKEAIAAVKALNSADYYSKTHKGQPLSRLMNGLEGAGNEFLKAQLQETLDKHNEAFKALSLREQLTGGM